MSRQIIRVLHVSHLYPNEQNPRLGKAVHSLLQHLISENCDSMVLAPVPYVPRVLSGVRSSWADYDVIDRVSVLDGIPVYRPRYIAVPGGRLMASSGKRMYSGLRTIEPELIRRADLIHAHVGLPDGFAAMLLAERYRKPLVTTLRGTDLDITVNRSRGKCKKVLSQVISRSSYVVTPSPQLTQKVRRLFSSSAITIPNGISPDSIREGLVSTPSNVILSVSELSETKGIQYNLLAMHKLLGQGRDLQYWIIGDGPYKQPLRKLCDELGIQDRVKFLGKKSHSETLDIIGQCTIFSLPSFQETFGLVYLEAMAQAKPVIGVIDQGIDGVITPGESGLLALPRDVESLVAQLSFLLDHPEKARDIGRNGKALVHKDYLWQQSAQRMRSLYEEAFQDSTNP